MRKTKLYLTKTSIGGKPFYLVAFPSADGKRYRRHFKSRAEAKAFHDQKQVELVNFGTAAAALNERDRAEYLECKELLSPYGLSLRDAISKILPQLKAENATCLVPAAVDQVLAVKEQDGMRKRYIKDLRCRLSRFSKDFADRSMASLTTAEIDDWLRSLGSKAVTRNNYRRILSVLFGYAVKRGYVLKNPVLDASKAKEVVKKVGILTPSQAATLLEKAPKEIVPAIAIGLFAGLRPESEIWRLPWENIDLEAGLIQVDADKTKGASNRFVQISDNLIEWLQPVVKKQGPVSPKGDKYYMLLEKARSAAKISKWPPDALRHSFASYLYAQFKDLPRAMAEMGHTNPRTFLNHYRERVKPSEAEKYWQIKPNP